MITLGSLARRRIGWPLCGRQFERLTDRFWPNGGIGIRLNPGTVSATIGVQNTNGTSAATRFEYA
jgi:hypothetical protein